MQRPNVCIEKAAMYKRLVYFFICFLLSSPQYLVYDVGAVDLVLSSLSVLPASVVLVPFAAFYPLPLAHGVPPYVALHGHPLTAVLQVVAPRIHLISGMHYAYIRALHDHRNHAPVVSIG